MDRNDDDNSSSTCHDTDDGFLPRDAEDCCRSDDEGDDDGDDYSVMEDVEDSLTDDDISGSKFTSSCSSDEDDLDKGECDGDNRHVRDVVEPASRPILKTLLIRDTKNGIPSPAGHLYREWQLHGKSVIADGNGADDDEDARFRRTEELLLLCAPTKKAKSNKKRNVCCDGGRVSVDPVRSSGGSISQQESAGTRLAAFLCNDLPKARVLWLTHGTFLVGTGPAAPDRNCSDKSSWSDCWKDFSLDVEWSVTLDVGATYKFQLHGSHCHHAARSHRRNGADLWAPLLLTIFARDSNVRAISCSSVSPSLSSSLAEIVSIAPPSPGIQGGTDGRGGPNPRPAHAPRHGARGTSGGMGTAPHLAAGRRHEGQPMPQAPRRVAHTPDEALASTLATGIRSTTVLEAITLHLSYRSKLLIGAVGENVGIRSVTVAPASTARVRLLQQFWRSVLASRTVQHVDVTARTADPRYTLKHRREVARLVVELLQSNRVVTHIESNAHTHDAGIMEAEARPLLQLNRLRSASANLGRSLPAVLASSAPVRRHPMLRYYVLRSNVGTVVRHLPMAHRRRCRRKRLAVADPRAPSTFCGADRSLGACRAKGGTTGSFPLPAFAGP
jgi:hypothetical protein